MPKIHHEDIRHRCSFDCPAVNHRMFVLESASDDPRGPYVFKGQIETRDQRNASSFAIDGTYFRHGDSIYHIYR